MTPLTDVPTGAVMPGPDNRTRPYTGKLARNQWVGTAAHFTEPHFVTAYVCYSDDDDRTWRRKMDGDLFVLHDWNAHFDFADEPSDAEVAPVCSAMTDFRAVDEN